MAVVGSRNITVGQLINVGTTAQPLSAGRVPCSEVMIQNDAFLTDGTTANTIDVWVGSDVSQPIRLRPDSEITVPVADVSMVYIRAASGTTVRVGWLGRE